MRKSALLLGLSLFVCTQTFADQPIFVETYDIPTTPCEGLSLDGVAYNFTIGGTPSLDCNAGTFVGPGFTNNISAPNIEGNATGVLHLTFDHTTTNVKFGVAQSTFAATQTVVVDLYRPGHGTLRQEVTLTNTNDPAFVGGLFEYSGPAVKTVTIRFPAGASYGRFALDNLSYFVPPGQQKK